MSAPQADLLVELQVKDEGFAKGLHQEAALGQMDGLRGRWRVYRGRHEDERDVKRERE